MNHYLRILLLGGMLGLLAPSPQAYSQLPDFCECPEGEMPDPTCDSECPAEDGCCILIEVPVTGKQTVFLVMAGMAVACVTLWKRKEGK